MSVAPEMPTARFPKKLPPALPDGTSVAVSVPELVYTYALPLLPDAPTSPTTPVVPEMAADAPRPAAVGSAVWIHVAPDWLYRYANPLFVAHAPTAATVPSTATAWPKSCTRPPTPESVAVCDQVPPVSLKMKALPFFVGTPGAPTMAFVPEMPTA